MKSSPKIEPAYLTIQAAAQYTSLSTRAIRRLLSMPGGLGHIRVGRGRILIERETLDSFFAKFRQVPLDLDEVAAAAVRELREGR